MHNIRNMNVLQRAATSQNKQYLGVSHMTHGLAPKGKNVGEMAVYKLKPGAMNRFDELQTPIVSALKGSAGFVFYNSAKAIEDETILIDYIEWETPESANAAAKKIAKMRELEPMMDSIAKVYYFTQF